MPNNDLCQTFFSISCINDDHIVMEAGKKVKHKYLTYDTSNHIGSIYRGTPDTCFDCFTAWYKHCYYPGIHTILTATLSPFKNDKILENNPTTKLNTPNVEHIKFPVEGRITIHTAIQLECLTHILSREEFSPYMMGYKFRGDFDMIMASIDDIYDTLKNHTSDFTIDFKMYTHSPSFVIDHLHPIGDDINV